MQSCAVNENAPQRETPRPWRPNHNRLERATCLAIRPCVDALRRVACRGPDAERRDRFAVARPSERRGQKEARCVFKSAGGDAYNRVAYTVEIGLGRSQTETC